MLIKTKSKTQRRRVGYNFNRKLGGESVSKHDREDNIRGQMRALKQDYRHSKGMSTGGTRKHLGFITPERYYQVAAEQGPEAIHDQKNLIRIMDEDGTRVSG